MKYIERMILIYCCFSTMIFINGCNTLPQFYQSAEDIADDTAIKIEISREAIKKTTDINLNVDIMNNPIN